MNQANRERVEQIKEIISTLGDLEAIKEIESFLYNNRMKIYNNGVRELQDAGTDTPEP